MSAKSLPIRSGKAEASEAAISSGGWRRGATRPRLTRSGRRVAAEHLLRRRRIGATPEIEEIGRRQLGKSGGRGNRWTLRWLWLRRVQEVRQASLGQRGAKAAVTGDDGAGVARAPLLGHGTVLLGRLRASGDGVDPPRNPDRGLVSGKHSGFFVKLQKTIRFLT